MKIFEVAGRIGESGEFILGSRETGSHGCYLIYGVVRPGERGRELKPGHGHEEIILVLQGDLKLSGQYTGTLHQGQALHLQDEESVFAENSGDAQVVYVVSGGHTGHGHH
jgi:uncharacterized cupin superfamily protein